MDKYESVPVDTITGKDLDYLCDMFQWNYSAFKRCCNDVEYINSEDIIELFGDASDFLDVISNPGGDISG